MPAKFAFSMQSLLNSREHKANRAKREFAEKMAAHAQQREILKKKAAELAEAEGEFKAALQYQDEKFFEARRRSEGGWAPSLQSVAALVRDRQQCAALIEVELEKQEATTERARQEEEETKDRTLECLRKQRAMEEFRSIREQAFQKAQELAEMAELSEIGSVIHFLNRDQRA